MTEQLTEEITELRQLLEDTSEVFFNARSKYRDLPTSQIKDESLRWAEFALEIIADTRLKILSRVMHQKGLIFCSVEGSSFFIPNRHSEITDKSLAGEPERLGIFSTGAVSFTHFACYSLDRKKKERRYMDRDITCVMCPYHYHRFWSKPTTFEDESGSLYKPFHIEKRNNDWVAVNNNNNIRYVTPIPKIPPMVNLPIEAHFRFFDIPPLPKL